MEDSFPRTRVQVGDGWGMIQVHYICCSTYFLLNATADLTGGMGPWLEKVGDPCSIGMLKHRLLVWGGDWELAFLQSSLMLQKLLIPNHTWKTTVLRDKIKGHPYFTCLHFPPIKKRQNLCPTTSGAKSLQSCPALCDPRDSSPPGSPVPGILQARTPEWVAISFSNAWEWRVKSESEVPQSCPTLSNPMDCSLPGSSVHGIFQARVVEWGAIAISESMPIPP